MTLGSTDSFCSVRPVASSALAEGDATSTGTTGAGRSGGGRVDPAAGEVDEARAGGIRSIAPPHTAQKR
jgi:hypothetical protein